MWGKVTVQHVVIWNFVRWTERLWCCWNSEKSHEVKIPCLCEIKTGLQLQWSRRWWDFRVQLNVYKCKSFSHPVTSSPLCHGCMTMVWYLMMRSVSLCCSCLLSTRLAGLRSESWSISTRGACSAARWSRSSSTHITTTWCTDCSTHCGTAWVHNSNTHTNAMWSCNTQTKWSLYSVCFLFRFPPLNLQNIPRSWRSWRKELTR